MKMFATFISIICVSLSSFADDTDVDLIRSVVKKHYKAVADQDGKSIAELASESTLKRAEEDRDRALDADEAAVRNLSYGRKLAILKLRAVVPAERLAKMSGEQIFAGRFTDKQAGQLPPPFDFGEIKIVGTKATATLLISGKPGDWPITMVNEAGKWKIDWRPFEDAATENLSATLKELGEDEDASILRSVEQSTGKRIDQEIWKPVRKKK